MLCFQCHLNLSAVVEYVIVKYLIVLLIDFQTSKELCYKVFFNVISVIHVPLLSVEILVVVVFECSL
jgi:hypothetical protein